MNYKPALLALILSLGMSQAQDTVCDVENPFGDDMPCDCDTQFILRNECQKGFFCTDTANNMGCLLECPDGQAVRPSFNNDTMQCVNIEENDGVCPGDFEVQCDPIGEVNRSKCSDDCDGQVWVSGDCKDAFFCYSRNPEGGLNLTCGDGFVVGFSLNSQQWNCVPDEQQCPGLGGFNLLKCPSVTPTQTPFEDGENFAGQHCGCENQVFVNDDCSSAFRCGENWMENKGQIQTCEYPENQILRLSFKEDIGQCVTRSSYDVCPGSWKIQCPNDAVPDDFDGESCICDGQILVSSDCKRGLYCYTNSPGNGELIECGDGQIVNLRLSSDDGSFGCIEDLGQCPSDLGGFNLIPNTGACNALTTTTTTVSTTTTTSTTTEGSGDTTTTTEGSGDTTTTTPDDQTTSRITTTTTTSGAADFKSVFAVFAAIFVAYLAL